MQMPLHRLLCLAVMLPLLYGARAGEPSSENRAILLVTIGDSTMANYPPERSARGWGTYVQEHFNSSVAVSNLAANGRSTKTFIEEGRWGKALELKPDYVLIQFGHNDSHAKGRPESTDADGDYRDYLRQYVNEARAVGATPLLITPVRRRTYDEQGNLTDNLQPYADAMKAIGSEMNVPVIDLHALSLEFYQKLGQEETGTLASEPTDRTHFNEKGARAIAELVLAELPRVAPALASQLETSGAAAGSIHRFSFGSAAPPPGFARVPVDQAYEVETGFGFERGARLLDQAQSVAGETPFLFSVKVPEGNYAVTVKFGNAEVPAKNTVKAELRRLMVEKVRTDAGEFVTRTFIVNIRTPEIPGGDRVRLKQRERENEMIAWDDKLTLEFNGEHPSLATLEITPTNVPTVYLLGDSTVCDQPNEPWNSWGQMLTRFFGPGVAVANHAQSGESIRSSLGAKRFDKVFSLMKPGDYLFLQFGHNDMKDRTPDALATYKSNLKKIVEQVLEKSATPVLVTSMERKAGVNSPTLQGYPDAVREVARENDVNLIDLNRMSLKLYRALGDDLDRAFQDGTHHNAYGSYQLARCVVESIRTSGLPLAKFLAEDVEPFDPAQPNPVDAFHVPASPAASELKPEGN